MKSYYLANLFGMIEKIDASKMTEDEYNEYNKDLHTKLKEGYKLTISEMYFLCDKCATHTLLKYPVCHDEFYMRFYLEHYSPTGFDKFEYRHLTYFKSMVKDWGTKISTTNHSSQLLKLVSEETRKELGIHKRRNRIISINYTHEQYNSERFDILSWSKYRYLIIKRTLLEEFTNDEYSLFLDGREIVFNYHSLVHIITRHFGEVMKPYNSGKDHFHSTFYYNNCHYMLEDIFRKIDRSGVYKDQSLKEINFRYDHIIYKVFCEYVIFQKKGTPDKKCLRVNSFFPVSNPAMLERLEKGFNEISVDQNLSIFVMK